MKQTHFKKRNILTVMLILLMVFAAVGGTIAYIATQSSAVTNVFSPGQMSCVINETFDGQTKTNVSVTNTGDGPAYIRVKLMFNWYAENQDEHVAGAPWTPITAIGSDGTKTPWSLSENSKWKLHNDGYYYYTESVPVNGQTDILIDTVILQQDEISRARQVLEITASCIQAEPEDAIHEAWGIDISNGAVTNYVAQGGTS